jgi:hypothetical protein
MDHNTKANKHSAVEKRFSVNANKNLNLISNTSKAKKVAKDIDELVGTMSTFDTLYVFFFQCQPYSVAFC